MAAFLPAHGTVCPGPCCIPVGAQPWGRWRGYVEGDSFEEASNWDDCHDDQCAITDVQNTPCDTRTQIRAWSVQQRSAIGPT